MIDAGRPILAGRMSDTTFCNRTIKNLLRPEKLNTGLKTQGKCSYTQAGLDTLSLAARTCPPLSVLAGHTCHHARHPRSLAARATALVLAASVRHGCKSNTGRFQRVVTIVATSLASRLRLAAIDLHHHVQQKINNLKQQKPHIHG